MRWGWDCLVAGTDGSVDERTEHMGTGYVVGDDRVPLMILSSPVGGPLASIRRPSPTLARYCNKSWETCTLLVFYSVE